MAPAKRPATAMSGKLASNEDSKKCRDVSAGLAKVEGVPREVSKMLGEMLDMALPVFKGERHEFQERIVAMGEKAFREHERVLEAKIAETSASIAQSEQAAAPQQQAVDGAEGAVKQRADAEAAGKRALAAAAQGFQGAKKGLDDAEASCSAFADELKAQVSKKEELERIQNEMLTPLADGSDEEKRPALVAALVKVLHATVGLEESITTAIPACLNKLPEARGAFDVMVVKQLREELARRVQAAAAELAQVESSKAPRDKAVDDGKAKLSAARNTQTNKAQEFWDSQAAHTAAQEDLGAKSDGLRALQKEDKKHRKELQAFESKLEAFREGPLATFASLSTRTRPEPEPEAAEAPAEEAPAEAAA